MYDNKSSFNFFEISFLQNKCFVMLKHTVTKKKYNCITVKFIKISIVLPIWQKNLF